MSLTTEFTAEESSLIERSKSTIRILYFFIGGWVGLLALAYSSHHPAWINEYVWIGFWGLYTSYFLFTWTSCFHETAHQTLNSNKMFSILLGRALGTAMFVPYTVYRESHIRHHAYLNKPNDWELWPYSDPSTSVWFRRAFVWVDLLGGVAMAPIVYGRLFFHKHSPLKTPEIRRTIWLEYAAIVVVWGAIFSALTYYGTWGEYFKIWFLPYWLAGVYQTARKLTEHLGMASYDPMLGTRTVVGKSFITQLCSFMNFDIFIHGPHHRHPRATHNVLGQKMKEYLVANPKIDFPLFNTYLKATASMVPFMFINPGVGMNVGAPAPGEAKTKNISNFVGDVTAEVLADTDAIVGLH
ncbi:MAG: fatty acid desaturase [Planctomycetales bacterium]